MGVSTVHYQHEGQDRWGVLIGTQIYPLEGQFPSLANFLLRGLKTARALAAAPQGEALSLEAVSLLSPVTDPCQIICQGKNYAAHALETGVKPEERTYNLLFSKAASSLAPPQGILRRPEGVRLLDYEVELGLVVGKTVRQPTVITPETLTSVIAGLVISIDATARDVQVSHGQWFRGKSYRGLCPTGPVLYLLDHADQAELAQLQLTLSVNGEIRQQALTGQMIFPPADTLSELSEILDLHVGDLVLTGTPGGVAMQMAPGWKVRLSHILYSEQQLREKFIAAQLQSGRFLQDGDRIEATIRSVDGRIDLGTQSLTVS